MKKSVTVEDIKRRAFFHWENNTGHNWRDPVSNWVQSEREAVEARPRMPYMVIDQNCFRDEEFVKDLLNRASVLDWQVLLPDAALMEMLKSEKWEYTMRRSLAHLAEAPELVSVALGFGELMRAERDTGEPVEDLIDYQVTRIFRDMLGELRSGQSGPVLALARAQIENAQDLAARQQLRHEHNKTVLKHLVDAWKVELSQDEIKGLGRDPSKCVGLCASVSMTRTCVIGLSNGGYSDNAARRLSAEPSVSGYWTVTLSALALNWLVAGGLDSLRPEKATNDFVDIDYVVSGVLGCALFSREARLNQLYEMMCAVAEARWEWIRELYAGASIN